MSRGGTGRLGLGLRLGLTRGGQLAVQPGRGDKGQDQGDQDGEFDPGAFVEPQDGEGDLGHAQGADAMHGLPVDGAGVLVGVGVTAQDEPAIGAEADEAVQA